MERYSKKWPKKRKNSWSYVQGGVARSLWGGSSWVLRRADWGVCGGGRAWGAGGHPDPRPPSRTSSSSSCSRAGGEQLSELLLLLGKVRASAQYCTNKVYAAEAPNWCPQRSCTFKRRDPVFKGWSECGCIYMYRGEVVGIVKADWQGRTCITEFLSEGLGRVLAEVGVAKWWAAWAKTSIFRKASCSESALVLLNEVCRLLHTFCIWHDCLSQMVSVDQVQ